MRPGTLNQEALKTREGDPGLAFEEHMEDLLDLDLDVGNCGWRFWDGLDQDASYFDAVLPIDGDFGLCSASSEENTLAQSPPSEDSATTSGDSPGFEPHLGDNLQDGVSESTVDSAESTVASKATSRNAARERSRVRSLRSAFQALQMSLPSVPPDTKLSKLDVLVLASNYIAHLGALLSGNNQENAEACLQEQVPALESASSRSYLHPVKKWPMRSRLYAGASPYADDRPKRHNCNDQWQAKKSRSSKQGNKRGTLT